MDSATLSKQYIDNYNKLIEEYNNSDIKETVNNINDAISKSDKEKIQEYYQKIQSWNLSVTDLEDTRLSLNNRFRGLHLPSVHAFAIVYDEFGKYWKFNTDAD